MYVQRLLVDLSERAFGHDCAWVQRLDSTTWCRAGCEKLEEKGREVAGRGTGCDGAQRTVLLVGRGLLMSHMRARLERARCILPA